MAPDHSRRANVIAARFEADFDDVDPLAKEIAARLVQITTLFEHDNAPLFELNQINRGQFSALVCLRLSGKPYELRHRDLMERMLLTSGGITNVCRRLETQGLIEKLPDPDDSRGVYFRLTEQGIELADALLPEQHLIERKLIDTLTQDQKQTLCDLLENLTSAYNR